ncbi:hypothetical protein [uncultured Prevotella sp.]|uniref:hypothetical protein n=1 Tax=uncultured Prevotella sp. TaxID=159272 RepID=UPI0025D61F8B|nr:hypothetical protein [uncultured Prevotella sp.]
MRNILVFGLVFILQSCVFFPIWENFIGIDVENNSDDSLLIYLASGMSPANPTVFPDTCLPQDAYVGERNLPHVNDSISGYLVPVSAHDKINVLATIVNTDYWGNGLYDDFFDDFVKVKILSFFFISADSFKKYGYNYVASHNMILSRYDLTESDMRSLDLTIPYPPTESMKDMRIWKP